MDARLNGNTHYLKWLEKDIRAGENKFLYHLILPLFTKLIDLGFNKKKQCEIVFSLFILGNFDDYVEKLEKYDDGSIDYDKGIARIHKIRSELKDIGLN